MYLMETKLFLKRNVISFMFFCKRSTVDLAYKIHGKPLSKNSVPILVIHGLMGSKKNFESIAKNIAATTKNTAITVDLRNHGDSPHTSSHTYLELAADISHLMKKVSVKRAKIVGHSMGGRTAMVLALTENPKVASLVVVDISPVSTAGLLNDFFPELLKVMETMEFQGKESISKARATVKKVIIESGVMKHDDSIDFILLNVGLKPNKRIGWLCNVETLKKYFESIATFPSEMKGKTYKGPTLFIGGGDSKYIPPEDIKGIRIFFPKAELKYIPNVGHNVHAEDPKTFLKLVNQFLIKY
ncbi:protein ABHD11-like [Bombyx mandarina]|uniref:sn-1-specific diacylglycerol lipase ABHD11 n=1 Tax=Bombyx mandarina TaxID=7092 RepID=A0A6J2K6K3_BOMMA|nr:protein ABHD11-like [Bombyx mandarina]